MQKCFYTKMGNKEYRSKTDFISASELKAFITSPYLYKKRYIDKQAGDSTSSLFFGNLCHTLLLEPEMFDKEYMVCYRSRRTNDYKDMVKEHPDKNIITTEEWDKANKLVEISKETIKQDGIDLKEYHPELSFFYEDKQKMKGRMDGVHFKDDIIFDYKTFSDEATDDAINRAFSKYRYDIQVQIYSKLYELATGRAPKKFIFCFQQTISPFACVIKDEIDVADMQIAAEDVRSALEELEQAKKTNSFPRAKNLSRKIGHPNWFRNKRRYENDED